MQNKPHKLKVFLSAIFLCFGLFAFGASQTAAQENSSFNKMPLIDWATELNRAIKEKEIDLTESFSVRVEGLLDENGKLMKPSFTVRSGNRESAKMAAKFIVAMSDANMLQYVKALNEGNTPHKVAFDVAKDEKQVTLQIISETKDESTAARVKSGLNLAIAGMISTKKGTEEGKLLEQIAVTNDKKQVVIKWQTDAAEALKKLQTKLAELSVEPAN